MDAWTRFFQRTAWYDGYRVLPHAWANFRDLLLASLSINLLSLAVPLAVMQVYDRIVPNRSMDTFWWLAGGGAFAVLLDAAMRWARAAMLGRMSAQFDHLVGCQTMNRLLDCRLEDYERVSVGEHLDSFNAIGTLANYYVGQVIQALLDLPFALLWLAAVAYLGGTLVWLPLGLIAVYLLLVFKTRRRFSALRGQQVEANDRRFDFVIETLRGLPLIKAQTVEEQMLRRYERLQESTAEINLDAGFWNRLPAESGLAFSQLAMFGLIALGSPLVRDGLMTVGGLSACMMLAGRAMQPIQSASLFWLRYADAAIARRRLRRIVRMQPFGGDKERKPLPGGLRGTVELCDLSYRYGAQLPWVLRHADLRIPAGAQVGIVGSSASGTTTLLLTMRGLLRAQEGTAMLDHYHLAEWDTTDMHGQIEYVPSRGTLFCGTILENIALFDSGKRDAALEAGGLMGLDDIVAMLPMGYETQVDNQSNNVLPMGLVQRICIARALVDRPRVLLFDKTDAALDLDSESMFLWLLERLRGHCTVVVVSYRPRILRRMDALYEIEGGRLLPRTVADIDRSVSSEVELF